MAVTATDRRHLEHCLELARQALDSGDDPFGSVLVSASGDLLGADHNHVAGGDHTQHPEFNLARWAANHLTPEQRAGAVLYTSNEHCPMCAAAHAWVGLGRIVYIASSAQLSAWLSEWGVPGPPVAPLPIRTVAPGQWVEGPVDDLVEPLRQLHYQRWVGQNG